MRAQTPRARPPTSERTDGDDDGGDDGVRG
jgi:hypothetical protein